MNNEYLTPLGFMTPLGFIAELGYKTINKK